MFDLSRFVISLACHQLQINTLLNPFLTCPLLVFGFAIKKDKILLLSYQITKYRSYESEACRWRSLANGRKEDQKQTSQRLQATTMDNGDIHINPYHHTSLTLYIFM